MVALSKTGWHRCQVQTKSEECYRFGMVGPRPDSGLGQSWWDLGRSDSLIHNVLHVPAGECYGLLTVVGLFFDENHNTRSTSRSAVCSDETKATVMLPQRLAEDRPTWFPAKCSYTAKVLRETKARLHWSDSGATLVISKHSLRIEKKTLGACTRTVISAGVD